MDRHTAQLSFINDKPTELREGPGVECCALGPLSPHPRANVRQILQHNRPLRAFGLHNNPFGETVVHVFGNQDPQPCYQQRVLTQSPNAKRKSQ
jgi:hypothetical protein